MKLTPAPACLAVGPDGKIDIDCIRRTKANAQYAAANIQGKSWPYLERTGWRVLNVMVMPVSDVTGDEPLHLTVTPAAEQPADPVELRDRPRKGPDVSRKPRSHRAGGGSSVMRFGK